MNIKPSTAEAQIRLRLDSDALITQDLESAIEQAYAQTLTMLDRSALHENTAQLEAALEVDPLHTGMVCTADIIAAQLLLVDALIGANSLKDRDEKSKAALYILYPHRRLGV